MNGVNWRQYSVKLVEGGGIRLASIFAIRGMTLLRAIVFARLFLKDDIGQYTFALSLLALLSTFADFGFNRNVIRSQRENRGFSDSAFTLSLLVAACLYIVVFLSAPIFSAIFSRDISAILRLLAVMLFSVPLRFPTVFWERQISFLHPSIAAILLEMVAFATAIIVELTFHFGVWSMAIGYAGGLLCEGAYLWLLSPQRPRLALAKRDVKPIFSFGTPLMVNNVNSQIMSRGDNLIVGLLAGSQALAYYSYAWNVPILLSSFIASMEQLVFPVFARIFDRKDMVRRLFNLMNKLWSVTGSFFGFFLILFADTIVRILFGASWLPMVPILQVMTLSFIIRFCTGYSYDAIAIIAGRTAYIMTWGLINSLFVIIFATLFIFWFGPIGGAWFWVIQATLSIPIIRFPLIKDILGTLEYVRHIWQPILAGLAAFASAWGVRVLTAAQPLLFRDGLAAATYFVAYLLILLLVDRRLMRDTATVFRLVRGRAGEGDDEQAETALTQEER